MKRALRTRGRILRARSIQHLQAAAEAAEAEGLVASLQAQSSQIQLLSRGMTPTMGKSFAADLAGASELAMRLRDAETMLERAINTARAGADRADAQRIEARIRQESAERLVQRARIALSDDRDRKAMLSGARRKIKSVEDAA